MSSDLSNIPDADAPPSIVFIVPYRDRVPQKHFFIHYMTQTVLADKVQNKDYAIYFVEQKDTRPFNRGAMKNIGFLALKYKYPLHYKDITFVFNDVDTVPHKNILDYKTSHGVIKHFYGFTFALGGIFSITGADFERIGGFPNFWGWGCEDNCINDRAIENGIYIDRTTFFKIGDMNILHIYDGVLRNICRREAYSHKLNMVNENIFTIKKLNFDTNYGSDGIINVDVEYFETLTDASDAVIETQDIQKTNKIDITSIVRERFGLNIQPPKSEPTQTRDYQVEYYQERRYQQRQQMPYPNPSTTSNRNLRSMSSIFIKR